MFRASSAHLQEDTVVHVQHVVLSLSMRVLGGLSVHSLSENWLEGEGCWWVSSDNHNTIPYATRVQLYPPEDEHLSLETCRGEYYFMNK